MTSKDLMSITSVHFEKWKSSLLVKPVPHRSKNFEGGSGKIRLNDTIAKIKKIKKINLTFGDHSILIQNLLYACYQARYAINPDDDIWQKTKRNIASE